MGPVKVDETENRRRTGNPGRCREKDQAAEGGLAWTRGVGTRK